MMLDNIEHARFLTRILTLMGLWTYTETNDTKKRINWQRIYRYTLHGSVTLSFNIFLWLYVIFSTDATQMLEGLYITLTESALMVKVLNAWQHAHLVNGLLNEWTTCDAYTLKTKEERLLWQREQRSFARIYRTYIGCSVAVVPTIFISGYFNAPVELPFVMWVPFDWQRSERFWYVFGYQLVTLTVTCISNISLDMLNCYLMQHMALCLRIFGLRLSALKQAKCPNGEKLLYEQLTQLIEQHQRIKRNIKQVEFYVERPTLVQILLSSLVLCFSIYRLQSINVAQNPGVFFGLCQYATAMTLQIFLPSYYANEITFYSDCLCNDIYNSDWPNMSRRNRFLVFCYMKYLKRPIVLRATVLFTMGLPLFTRILNQAYSLLALLLNMND